MRYPFISRRGGGFVLAVVLGLVLLGGCGDIAGALPLSPSPFPTLERLPSVTPIGATATLAPTRIVILAPPTATPAPLTATAAVDANMRAGPGIDFAVVAVVGLGETVLLEGQSAGWFQVQTADGTQGWMASQVLELDEATATLVPTVTP